jgi:hypothetical protein
MVITFVRGFESLIDIPEMDRLYIDILIKGFKQEKSGVIKGIVRQKLRWVKSGINRQAFLTLNLGYFIFKFKDTPSFNINKTCFSIYQSQN